MVSRAFEVSWIRHQINQKDGPLDSFPLTPSPSLVASDSHRLPRPSGISPSVLFIIVISSILFTIACLLLLLLRILTKRPSTSQTGRNPDASSSSVLQRQLQELFHSQDCGLDQAFIDTLPVFTYKEVIGPKDPFDCAVCLSEFSGTDQLRLLPICGHAFHVNCIDSWLVSNSTCPLCRGSPLNPGFLSDENPVLIRKEDGWPGYKENGFSIARKRLQIEEVVRPKAGFPVRLGKFRKLKESDNREGQGEASSSKLDGRRCYSMGTYQYVVGDSALRVTLRQDHVPNLVQEAEESCNDLDDDRMEGKKLGVSAKSDSYSVSKIWLWSKKGKFTSSNLSSTGMDLTMDAYNTRHLKGAVLL